MRTTGGIILGTILGLLITLITHEIDGVVCSKSTKMEIYTLENVYYINVFTVTNRNNDIVVKFGNKQELAKYIWEVTVRDNQAGRQCLMAERKMP